MQVKVQVVTITDEGQEITREVACVERHDLTPVTLGLSLAELLPERTTPELLFLESTWAALVA
jgi:hypothetical protein